VVPRVNGCANEQRHVAEAVSTAAAHDIRGGSTMRGGKKAMMLRGWAAVIIAFGLMVVGPISAYAQEEGPGTVCIVQVQASGEVLTTVVDDTFDIDVAVVVPRDNFTNLPVRCQDIAQERLGLAAANQEPFEVSLNVRVYTNKGELVCTRGPFALDPNGGRGVAFKDCL
jgi:hypothetical protein